MSTVTFLVVPEDRNVKLVRTWFAPEEMMTGWRDFRSLTRDDGGTKATGQARVKQRSGGGGVGPSEGGLPTFPLFSGVKIAARRIGRIPPKEQARVM